MTEHSLFTQCPLCERTILKEVAIDHGPGDCVPVSHAMWLYLACEKRAQRWADEPNIVEHTHEEMDELWLELSEAERAWINGRGEMKP